MIILKKQLELKVTILNTNNLSLQANLLNYIMCPCRTVAGKFLLVDQHWQVHVYRSIRELRSWVLKYIYIYIYIYIHHHVALVARISLTLSRHSSLSFVALGRSSGQHPVSSHSCWMYVRAGRPAFARPCVGVHKSTSLMSSSLLLQQCPACLVRLTWIVFVIGGRWPYSWCLVGCCRQDLLKIAHTHTHIYIYIYVCMSV